MKWGDHIIKLAAIITASGILISSALIIPKYFKVKIIEKEQIYQHNKKVDNNQKLDSILIRDLYNNIARLEDSIKVNTEKQNLIQNKILLLQKQQRASDYAIKEFLKKIKKYDELFAYYEFLLQ